MGRYISVDQLRARVETAVATDALEDLIGAQEQVLDRWAGALTIGDYEEPDPVTEVHERVTGSLVELRARPSSIDTVTLYQGSWDADGTAFLEEDDWRLLYGDVVARNDGAIWGGRVVVVYVPTNDLLIRRNAIVKLCELELNWQPGLGSEGAQGWQESYNDRDRARQSILEDVHQPPLFA
jgi:hypothetical protein